MTQEYISVFNVDLVGKDTPISVKFTFFSNMIENMNLADQYQHAKLLFVKQINQNSFFDILNSEGMVSGSHITYFEIQSLKKFEKEPLLEAV